MIRKSTYTATLTQDTVYQYKFIMQWWVDRWEEEHDCKEMILSQALGEQRLQSNRDGVG